MAKQEDDQFMGVEGFRRFLRSNLSADDLTPKQRKMLNDFLSRIQKHIDDDIPIAPNFFLSGFETFHNWIRGVRNGRV